MDAWWRSAFPAEPFSGVFAAISPPDAGRKVSRSRERDSALPRQATSRRVGRHRRLCLSSPRSWRKVPRFAVRSRYEISPAKSFGTKASLGH